MQNVIPEPCYTSLLTARQRLQQLPPGGRKDHLARRSLLGALRNCPANAVVLDEVGEGLRLLGEPAAALAVFRCGARRGLWRHPLQRVTEKETQMQLHSVAVLEDDAMHDFPELQRVHHLVEKHHGRIRMEFLRALQNPRVWRVAASLLPCNHDKLCWEKRKLPHGGVAGRWHIGSWQHFYIMQKTDGEFACAHGLYPHTCRLLEMIEAMGLDLMRAQVSTVKGTPVGFIAAHRSHVQERMRLNCAISVPENSSSVLRFPGYLKKAYQKGKKCFWFDESYEHDLIHEGELRASFILDLRHPGLDGRKPSTDWHKTSFAVERFDAAESCEDIPEWPLLPVTSSQDSPVFFRENSGFGFVQVGVLMARSESSACEVLDQLGSDVCVASLKMWEGTSPEAAVTSFASQHRYFDMLRQQKLLDFLSTNLPYHGGTGKIWSTKHGDGHTRTSVISYLQKRFALSRYLEIGCDDGRHFAFIRQNFDTSECVDPRPGGTLQMTSDVYFKTMTNEGSHFDIVLVDGLHTGEQALRDVENTLERLNPGGFIVMHDCNPNSFSQAQKLRNGAFHWTGDVFRAVVALRQREDLDVAVGDFDYGVAVVMQRPRRVPLFPPLQSHEVWNMSYADFALRREELLNLMTWEDMVRWIDG